MKKLLFAAFLLLALSPRAQSQTVIVPTNCFNVAIASAPATEVTGNNPNIALSSAVWFVSVTNLDPSSVICCSQNPAITCSGTITSDVNPILPQAGATTMPYFLGWYISTTERWYCANSSGAGTTKASICKFQ